MAYPGGPETQRAKIGHDRIVETDPNQPMPMEPIRTEPGRPSPYATNTDPLSAEVPEGAAAAPPPDAEMERAVAAQEAEQQQIAQTGKRGRSGLRIEDAGYGPTTEDLFPNMNRPLQVGRSTQVGKYGGGPLFVGSGGVLPLGVIGGKLRSIYQEKEALRKQAKDLDIFSDFEKVKRAEYEPALQAAQVAVWDKWRDAAVDAHGDPSRAMAAFADPSNKWHQGLYRDIERVNATTRLVNQNIEDAQAVIKGMDDDDLEDIPAIRDNATELLQKLGQWGDKDWGDLAGKSVMFQKQMSMLRWIKGNDVSQLLARAQQEVTKEEVTGKDQFGRIVNTKHATSGANPAADMLARKAAKKFGISEKDAMDILEPLIPTKDETTIDTQFPPQRSGGSGSASDRGYSYAFQRSPIKTEGTPAREYDQVVLADVTGGKGKFSSPRQFFGASGASHFMHPVSIADDGKGGRYIYGKIAKEPGAVRVEGDENTGYKYYEKLKGGKEKELSEAEYFSSLQDYFVPYTKRNEGLIETYFPGLTETEIDRVINEGRAKSGIKKGATSSSKPSKGKLY